MSSTSYTNITPTEAATDAIKADDDTVTPAPMQLAMTDGYRGEPSTFNSKSYTFYKMQGNPIGPIRVSPAFINDATNAKTRGKINMRFNLTGDDKEEVFTAFQKIGGFFFDTAKGKRAAEGGIVHVRRDGEEATKKKAKTNNKARIIQPIVSEHEVAGVIKRKTTWPKFTYDVDESERHGKTYYSMNATFFVPLDDMPVAWQQEHAWHEGSGVYNFPDTAGWRALVTTQFPEATELNIYVVPQFIQCATDVNNGETEWKLKWKVHSMERILDEGQDENDLSNFSLEKAVFVDENEWDPLPSAPDLVRQTAMSVSSEEN